MSNKKKMTELIKEFINTYCEKCDAYVICGGECVGCKDFDKFIKENKNGE